MLNLSDKLEGYENYVTQDLNGEIYKWEYKPTISKFYSEWLVADEEVDSNSWGIPSSGSYAPNWKESLVDLSTHDPYLIGGILTPVPKLMLLDELAPDVEVLWEETKKWDVFDKKSSDVVNKPEHYRQGDIECIDAIKSATTHKLGIAAVCVANVIKYLWRYESKNGLEDVKKAQWYLNRLIMEMEENDKSFSLKQGEKKDDKKVL